MNYLGQCIEINSKCNGVVDCDDGTDELECEFLILDKNYSKNKLPLPNAQALKDEPVKVYFSITMTSYPRIDASNSRYVILNLKYAKKILGNFRFILMIFGPNCLVLQ